MKIFFIVASLKIGQDGVGDYTRHLAEALEKMGCQTAIIALNDRHTEFRKIKHDVNKRNIKFGVGVNWNIRLQLTGDILYQFSPDLISLQYVSFGFHHKGMPLLLPNRLGKIGKSFSWHIMFHELWNGENRGSKFSHRLLGFFEKQIIFSLCKKLKPRLCTTSNALYHEWLKREKIDNQILPLFSNIPPVNDTQNICSTTHNMVAIFGSLESEELGDELISTTLKMVKNRHLIWKVLGLAGSKWENVLLKYNLPFQRTGHLSESELASEFQSCRFGLASTNVYRIGKSGSALAMLANGLPLLVGRSGWIPCHSNLEIDLPDGCLGCWQNPNWDQLPERHKFKKPPSCQEVAQYFVYL